MCLTKDPSQSHMAWGGLATKSSVETNEALKINRLNVSGYADDLKKWRERKRTVKGDRGELAKEPSKVKSVFSLEHKDNEYVNSKTYIGLMESYPVYREFLVGLLARIHYHHGRCGS